jgi:hypothetical protein
MWVLVVTGAFFVIGIIRSIFESAVESSAGKASELKTREENLQKAIAELQKQKAAWLRQRENAIDVMETMRREKSLGFPWLAKAYSDYFELLELQTALELETKKPPAKKSAETVRIIAAEKAQLRRENRILRELHRYYETLFPWLIDFKGEDLDDLIRQANQPLDQSSENDQDHDPVVEWLSQAEFNSDTLTRTEKFQRALDRYWSRRKAPWQIGRDYERYVGYIHERDGYNVEYHGIVFGYEDMGRDLICIKGNDIRIVQCKYWSREKIIHEKHVCQLLGTVIMYEKSHQFDPDLFGNPSITAWLYTSCSLSKKAREFAKLLGVQLVENDSLGKYPMIKCNVSRRDGAKIYHLPFDQQYDRTLIEYEDECYVETVAEAEALGFRRAFRWKGGPEAR